MISEEKILVLSQLISSMKEAVLELEEAVNSKSGSKIIQVKENIAKLNKEIKDNLV